MQVNDFEPWIKDEFVQWDNVQNELFKSVENGKKKVVVNIHGWISSYGPESTGWQSRARDAFTEHQDVIFVAVNWGQGRRI